MNIGYLLFMGLLCTTLTLWAIVAIRDDGKGVSEEEEELTPEQSEENSESSEPAVDADSPQDDDGEERS